MVNNKGFTLVELLAVIVVLGIISLIGYVMVSNVIDHIQKQVEIQNARTLSKIVNDYIISRQMNGNIITKDEFYIIKNNIEYSLNEDGTTIGTSNFNYKGDICNYCVIKIKPDKSYSILLEGKEQDIKKYYSSNEIKVLPLEYSRKVTSNYNEIILFKDIYVANNEMNGSTKLFQVNGNKILDTSTNQQVFILNNSSGNGTIEIITQFNFVVKLNTDENETIESDSLEDLHTPENINKIKYSEDIINLYNELKNVANRYIASNTITSDIYFEFADGNINIVDIYGNPVVNSSVVMNNKINGSGELRINTLKEYSVVIYDEDYDIKNNYGEELLYEEPLKYSRDNIILFRNLHRLELLAEKYLNGATSSDYQPSQSDWLVFFYIRRLKYNNDNYNIITGNNSGFVTYVSNNASYLKTYFTNKNTFTINDDTIDLKHFAASLAGNMFNTNWIYNLVYEELEYDCAVSWGGDLHQFMEYDVLKSGLKAQYGSYENVVYNLLGKSNTSFSMEDIHADIDEWNIYYNMRTNKNLNMEEIFDAYYSGTASRNYKNRYTSFMKIMDSVGNSLAVTNFDGLVNHFTNVDKGWDTIGTLAITPTEAEEKEIADGFIKWIKDKAALE